MRYFKFIFIVLSIVLLSGCKTIVDEEPVNNHDDEEYVYEPSSTDLTINGLELYTGRITFMDQCPADVEREFVRESGDPDALVWCRQYTVIVEGEHINVFDYIDQHNISPTVVVDSGLIHVWELYEYKWQELIG